MVELSAIVATARSFIDTPFAHQGRMPGIALDCAGHVYCAALEHGLAKPEDDVLGYPREPDGTLLAHCRRVMIEIDRESMRPGHVVAVRMDREPHHLGILGDYWHGVGLLSIIHALGPRSPAKVVEHRLVFGRTMRFVAAFRIPGTA